MLLKLKLNKLYNKFFKRPQPRRYDRYQLRFKEKYPSFTMGRCTYGIPVIKHWDRISTLEIGSFTSIAENVAIYLGGNHHMEWVTTYPMPFFFPEATNKRNYGVWKRDVRIGSDVWLCDDIKIFPGVSIGHGAVVAAGSIVTKDVEPYAVVAGNPAKLVRWRFDEPTEKLLSTEWWNWPEEELMSIIDLICSDNIQQFLVYADNRAGP